MPGRCRSIVTRSSCRMVRWIPLRIFGSLFGSPDRDSVLPVPCPVFNVAGSTPDPLSVRWTCWPVRIAPTVTCRSLVAGLILPAIHGAHLTACFPVCQAPCWPVIPLLHGAHLIAYRLPCQAPFGSCRLSLNYFPGFPVLSPGLLARPDSASVRLASRFPTVPPSYRTDGALSSPFRFPCWRPVRYRLRCLAADGVNYTRPDAGRLLPFVGWMNGSAGASRRAPNEPRVCAMRARVGAR